VHNLILQNQYLTDSIIASVIVTADTVGQQLMTIHDHCGLNQVYKVLRMADRGEVLRKMYNKIL